ncbi:E3 SUMO-protein ligase ZBED1-like [Opisthocomus hoazin]|uniref:E3 SUMO-protein ligase ZBED1-like n=1 Tax=Opisthocomus hoazin TaxID=30419 RepID=UPI003F5332D3
MGDASSPRVPQLLPKRPKTEGEGAEARPKEEAPEEAAAAALVPPSLREETPLAFGAFGMAAAALAPPSRRKREKGAEGASAALSVDRRKSKVWNYYAKLGDAYVECNVCKKQLSFHNSTTTMREHLVRKHGIRDALLSHLKDEQVAESDCGGAENVGKRSRQTPPENGFYQAEARSDVILELVLEMIFRDLHPLSVVRDKGFGLLVGYLEPGFALPAPAQLAGMLRHRYGVVKQHLERYLQTAEAVAVCVELWASQLSQSYLSVAASFVDGEWRRARCMLATQRAHEDEAEGGLGEKLHAVLRDFGLSGKSVFCVVHDGPRGAAAASWQPLRNAYGWSGLGCAARTLHLCIRAGLEVEQVREALGIARGIVRFFQQDARASRSLNSKLEAINKSKLKLVMDAGSRWITTVEMCESLLDLKWAIMSVLEEQPKGAAAVRNLADHQWKLLQDLVPIMRTIRIATSFLREEQNASVSSLMPCVHGIVAAIGQQAEEAGTVIKTVVGNIRAELTRRWGLAEDEKVLENPAVIASFLDPRFKEMRFLSPGLRSALHERVKAMLSQVFSHQCPPAARPWVPGSDYKAEGGEAGSPPPAHKAGSLSAAPQSVYDILLGKDPAESMPEIHQQLENYIVEPLCKRSTDPLDWWKNNERRFPAVARLSRRYLAVPATAVPPEQAFAAGESALEQRRAVLAPENLDQILFLHQNFDFLESLRNSNEARSRSLH